MINKFSLILIICVFFSCRKQYFGPDVVADNLNNSLNFGLIGLNKDNLFLNKENNIVSYDFNGTQVNLLNTYDRNKYHSMVVRDSIFALSFRDFIFYKMSNAGQLEQLPIDYGSFMGCHPSELSIMDSVLIVLNDRFVTTDSRIINNRPFQNKTLTLLHYNKHKKLLSVFDRPQLFNIEASSFSVMQDSIVFFANTRISQFNIKDVNTNVRRFDFNLNPENTITSMVSKGNQLYTSNSKNIFFFEFTNNDITLKGEVR